MRDYKVIEKVPTNYYQSGIENNLLQKFWHTRKLNEVLNITNNSNNLEKILDVGCASGWFISQVNKKYHKASCFGIDIYDAAILYARKNYPKINFKVADANKIPYKEKTFDLVICTEVLEHVDNPKEVLLEIKRVLKKRGVTVIELDSGSMLFSIAWFIWRQFKGKIWNDAHLHSFNVKKLETLIKSCDFKIVKSKKFNFGMAMIFYCVKK